MLERTFKRQAELGNKKRALVENRLTLRRKLLRKWLINSGGHCRPFIIDIKHNVSVVNFLSLFLGHTIGQFLP
jgi:hypothetical protein